MLKCLPLCYNVGQHSTMCGQTCFEHLGPLVSVYYVEHIKNACGQPVCVYQHENMCNQTCFDHPM